NRFNRWSRQGIWLDLFEARPVDSRFRKETVMGDLFLLSESRQQWLDPSPLRTAQPGQLPLLHQGLQLQDLESQFGRTWNPY
ncbi:hypothetical protein, partial [Ensifer sp. SSB1]|uniref:hypothetical protein n=1 Tax=Ensifer sp. SSB1 TaxID=2795385 RepID=UPI0025B9C0BE